MIYFAIFFIAFLSALFFSPLTIKLSSALNVFSKPDSGAEKGKPCLGGIAIYLAFLITSLLMYFFKRADTDLLKLVIASTLIVGLGFIDDLKDLRPFVKIMVELLAVALLIPSGFVTRISFLPSWSNILLTCVWGVLIINAFNLLDIMDGLTSGLVVIISSALLAVSLVNRDIFSALVLAGLIGGHLGFLRYNYPPARLYMGDTGSLFSGFLLAVIAVNISYSSFERPVALITPLLAMSLPIYDTLFLIIMRINKKRPIFARSSDHFALRLVNMGYSVHRSIWHMYLFGIFLAVSSLVVGFGSNMVGIFMLLVVAGVFTFTWKKLAMVKVDNP